MKKIIKTSKNQSTITTQPRRSKTWRVVVKRYFGAEAHVFETIAEALAFTEVTKGWTAIECGSFCRRRPRVRRVISHTKLNAVTS